MGTKTFIKSLSGASFSSASLNSYSIIYGIVHFCRIDASFANDIATYDIAKSLKKNN